KSQRPRSALCPRAKSKNGSTRRSNPPSALRAPSPSRGEGKKLRIVGQHLARQIERAADEDARRAFVFAGARPGRNLHHGIREIVGGRGFKPRLAHRVVKRASS